MLKLHATSGSVELTADQERYVRGLSDEEVCNALNLGKDVYVSAVLGERPRIGYSDLRGWYVKGCTRSSEPVPPRERMH